MEMNIFEQASRNKLRFPSIRNELTAEQLWDLPLQSKSGFDLDSVAKAVNTELKSLTAESFIPSVRSNPRKTELELALAVVVHIITVRVDENAKKVLEAERTARKAKLMDALERKQDAELLGMSSDQIREELAKL